MATRVLAFFAADTGGGLPQLQYLQTRPANPLMFSKPLILLVISRSLGVVITIINFSLLNKKPNHHGHY